MQDLNELEVYTSGAFDWQQTEQWSLLSSSSYLAAPLSMGSFTIELPDWNCAVPVADSRSLV